MSAVNLAIRDGLATLIQCCLIGSIFLVTAVTASELTDPTRPPKGYAVVSGASASSPIADSELVLSLQSVLLSANKQSAIINGREIMLGEQFDNARLTEIHETCVVLNGAQGRQVLRLYAAVSLTKNDGACALQPQLKHTANPNSSASPKKGNRNAPVSAAKAHSEGNRQ